MPITDELRKSIYDKVKKELKKCCPPLVVSKEKDGVYELMGNKPVPYGYNKRIVPGMYFASVVSRKTNVSFYFFPIYGDPATFKKLAPSLMKCLDGKTCFHFTKEEQLNLKELSALLKKGVDVWHKQGYMKD